MGIEVTKHAVKRAKQRLGLKSKSVRRLAVKAIKEGKEIDVVGGDLYSRKRRMFTNRGCIFIFAVYSECLLLLTIIDKRQRFSETRGY